MTSIGDTRDKPLKRRTKAQIEKLEKEIFNQKRSLGVIRQRVSQVCSQSIGEGFDIEDIAYVLVEYGHQCMQGARWWDKD
jgi:hypothetical protein